MSDHYEVGLDLAGCSDLFSFKEFFTCLPIPQSRDAVYMNETGREPCGLLVQDKATPYPPTADRFHRLREGLIQDGLFEDRQPSLWRLSPAPFLLSSEECEFFRQLGQHLLAFYRGLDGLYLDSIRGRQPSWVHEYLDQGKPEALVAFGRMKRFRGLLPQVIRPDVIPTAEGRIITELDSVPGGMGLTGSLAQAYAALAEPIVGGADGMVQGFAAMIREQMGKMTSTLAIVVSDESESYRSEMRWLAQQLVSEGIQTACVHPKEIRFTEAGLELPDRVGSPSVSMVYRFFELFDLKNVAKAELVMYSVKKGQTVITPPYKPWLEEKLAFALFHHPVLKPYWKTTLPEETFTLLHTLLPQTWVVDPRPVPPSAIIPGLTCDGRAVTDFRVLGHATQKHRRYVLKPSGFSELAWGSHGIAIGHDLSQSAWAEALESAMASFSTSPYILQEFHKGRQCHMEYFDEDRQAYREMDGRVRLSPYYFVYGEQAHLGGILATVCPKDKKVIHGMRDAIMAPCGMASDL